MPFHCLKLKLMNEYNSPILPAIPYSPTVTPELGFFPHTPSPVDLIPVKFVTTKNGQLKTNSLYCMLKYGYCCAIFLLRFDDENVANSNVD